MYSISVVTYSQTRIITELFKNFQSSAMYFTVGEGYTPVGLSIDNRYFCNFLGSVAKNLAF